MPRTGEISLYFHIPFCAKKCPYCHFFVLPDQERFKAQFLRALRQEWEFYRPELIGKKIVSIYFGGGTPTRLSQEAFAEILSWVKGGPALLDEACEITIEANPEDVSVPFIHALALLGINRVSIGVQSLDDSHLQRLGRRHSAERCVSAIHACATAGMRNISIDLMYDLPHQTLESWHRTLAEVARLPITHLSLYNLTLEPHTVFFKRKNVLAPTLPSPELSLLMLHSAVEALEKMGLVRYEISAFAREGKGSLHNIGYWTARPFLGFGPSAFSYWKHKRFQNICNLNGYEKKLCEGIPPIHFEETLSEEGRHRELLAVQLRLVQGVDLHAFTEQQGPFSHALTATLEELKKKGWIEQQGACLRLTSEGQLFYDSVGASIV